MVQAANDDLRLYPDPEAFALREAIARVYGLAPENVFVGNGSDEVLALSFLAFCDPGRQPALRYADITYSFYPVYASLFRMTAEVIPLKEDYTFPIERVCDDYCPLLICNPNAPTSLGISTTDMERILSAIPSHPVLVDEAYGDFGHNSVIGLIPRFENLLVIRTLSKSHGLAGLRVGYALGSAHMIEGLNRIKNCFNSYPLDRIAQAGAAAAISDVAYTKQTLEKIVSTRDRTAASLRQMGFLCPDSSANFLFAEHPEKSAAVLMAALRHKGILVRHFSSQPRIANRLRITVGTDAEMAALLQALEEILT